MALADRLLEATEKLDEVIDLIEDFEITPKHNRLIDQLDEIRSYLNTRALKLEKNRLEAWKQINAVTEQKE